MSVCFLIACLCADFICVCSCSCFVFFMVYSCVCVFGLLFWFVGLLIWFVGLLYFVWMICLRMVWLCVYGGGGGVGGS